MRERYATIERCGFEVRRTSLRGACDRTTFEYWAVPVAASVLHKLGQITRVGSGQLQALRAMKSGTQLRDDLLTLRDAEDWIAECDAWGPLRRATDVRKENR